MPKICEYLDTVEYIELGEEECVKLVEVYNKEGLVNRHNTVLNRRLKTKQAISIWEILLENWSKIRKICVLEIYSIYF